MDGVVFGFWHTEEALAAGTLGDGADFDQSISGTLGQFDGLMAIGHADPMEWNFFVFEIEVPWQGWNHAGTCRALEFPEGGFEFDTRAGWGLTCGVDLVFADGTYAIDGDGGFGN